MWACLCTHMAIGLVLAVPIAAASRAAFYSWSSLLILHLYYHLAKYGFICFTASRVDEPAAITVFGTNTSVAAVPYEPTTHFNELFPVWGNEPVYPVVAFGCFLSFLLLL